MKSRRRHDSWEADLIQLFEALILINPPLRISVRLMVAELADKLGVNRGLSNWR